MTNMEDQKCRICGCTDNDCSQCIRITGKPCHWVEEDLCSACADALSQQSKINDMNFFQQLAGIGGIDLTMRIMQKNDKLTINIMPGAGAANIQPILVTGTPTELDEEFFKSIAPGVKEISGIVTNLQEVKQEAEKKKDEKQAAAAKNAEKPADKRPASKKEDKKPKAEKPEKAHAEEPNLFPS